VTVGALGADSAASTCLGLARRNSLRASLKRSAQTAAASQLRSAL